MDNQATTATAPATGPVLPGMLETIFQQMTPGDPDARAVFHRLVGTVADAMAAVGPSVSAVGVVRSDDSTVPSVATALVMAAVEEGFREYRRRMSS